MLGLALLAVATAVLVVLALRPPEPPPPTIIVDPAASEPAIPLDLPESSPSPSEAAVG